MYAEYKANRKAMPDDLALQIEPIRHAVRALGWPVIEIEGIEADDVIATLARRARWTRADAGDGVMAESHQPLRHTRR
jgi:5'-3' exonuclease